MTHNDIPSAPIIRRLYGTIKATDYLIYPDGQMRRPKYLIGCDIENYADLVHVYEVGI